MQKEIFQRLNRIDQLIRIKGANAGEIDHLAPD
jgi:hypothetical protein